LVENALTMLATPGNNCLPTRNVSTKQQVTGAIVSELAKRPAEIPCQAFRDVSEIAAEARLNIFPEGDSRYSAEAARRKNEKRFAIDALPYLTRLEQRLDDGESLNERDAEKLAVLSSEERMPSEQRAFALRLAAR
jgi:hypothetical protein